VSGYVDDRIILYVEGMKTMVEIGLPTISLLCSSGCNHLTYVTVCDFYIKSDYYYYYY